MTRARRLAFARRLRRAAALIRAAKMADPATVEREAGRMLGTWRAIRLERATRTLTAPAVPAGQLRAGSPE